MFSVNDWDEALAAMTGLQDAAVEADAEPGMSAGIHVHVKQPAGERERARAFLAFVTWEDALINLAQGRFAYLRDMNRRVRTDVTQYLYNYGDIQGSSRSRSAQAVDVLNALVGRARTGDEYGRAYDLYCSHYDADRHSHLSVNTRFGTWEFRIWNSTRSAWRIEMACRMAVAWATPAFVDALIAHEGVRRNVGDLLSVIAEGWQGDDRLAALVNRQMNYLPRAEQAPARFLVA